MLRFWTSLALLCATPLAHGAVDEGSTVEQDTSDDRPHSGARNRQLYTRHVASRSCTLRFMTR